MKEKMSRLTWVPITTLILLMLSKLNDVQCDCSYDDAEDACNHNCTFYDYEDENGGDESCSHKEFSEKAPIGSLEKYKDMNISLCCDGHHYLHKDNCEGRDTHLQFVCGRPKNAPQNRIKKLEDDCPEECRGYGWRGNSEKDGLKEDRFNISIDGTMCVKDKTTQKCPQSREVIHYCLFYHCNADDFSWEVRAHACDCPKTDLSQNATIALQTALKQEENEFQGQLIPKSLSLTMCCPEGTALNETKSTIKCRNLTTDVGKIESRFQCHNGKFKNQKLRLKNVVKVKIQTHGDEKISFKTTNMSKPSMFEQHMYLNINSTDYCIGFESNGDQFDTVLRTCDSLCYGNHPCIRICAPCPGHHFHVPEEVDSTDGCHEMTDELKETIFPSDYFPNDVHQTDREEGNEYHDRKGDNEHGDNEEENTALFKHGWYTDSQPKKEKDKCVRNPTKPYTSQTLIKRSIKCFDLKQDGNGEVVLEYKGKIFTSDRFCIRIDPKAEQKTGHIADICEDFVDSSYNEFYPIIILLGTILLAVTIGIYTLYPKLLNPYTRMMRHFAFVLFLAFSILWPQKSFPGQKNPLLNPLIHPLLCKFVGFFTQYLFLVSFTFMTSLSLETWNQLRGFPSNGQRYRRTMLFSYGFPTIVVALTQIAEATLSECSDYKPRFGELDLKCSFKETHAEFLWFLLPMIILLTVNAGLFTNVVFILVNLDRQKQDLRLKANQQKEARERCILYCKLFIGMGFIWITEILQKIIAKEEEEKNWISADVINMMQPFYVFVIFCCKRKVIKVVTGKDDPRKSAIATRSKRRSTKSTEIQMSVIQNETDYSSIDQARASECPLRDIKHPK